MHITRNALAALTICSAVCAARADVKFAPAFSDHMVLQRDMKLPIWGTADAGETVTVTAGPDKASATADADGKWSVALDPLKASDNPIEVTAAGKTSATLSDVLVGDVWVASGQSNMQFALNGASNAWQAKKWANQPTMRLLHVKLDCEYSPGSDVGATWQVCSDRTAAGFSAVAFFFGLDIQADQHVPIGLIGTYWGAQAAQSFTSLEGLKAERGVADLVEAFEKAKLNLPTLETRYNTVELPAWQRADKAWKEQAAANFETWQKQAAQAAEAHRPAPPQPVPTRPEPAAPVNPSQNPRVPTVIFNGMIHPLVPMAIKGVIWYQGESNSANPVQYQTLFPGMIDDWRRHWGQGDFPFIWVQLANFRARQIEPTQSSDGWAGLREAQSMTLKLPNTAQAVIIDIGEADKIHPTDKLDVGKRLALAARHVAYGEDLVYSGPTYDTMKIEGGSAIVHFKNVGAGLTIAVPPATPPFVPPARPASSLKGFAIAGEDRHFYWADAAIDGDSVIVTSDKVPHPLAVRYGWADNPEVNLYNKDGLPASPFRTDAWIAETAAAKK